MLDLLHDEIDEVEDQREEATAALERVRAQMPAIAKGAADFREVLEEAALRYENELADLTTAAARAGMKSAVNRAAKAAKR